MNRKISTDTTLQIALLAHSGGREQQKSETMAARTTGGGRGPMHAGIHPPRGANNPTPSGPPSPPSNPSPTISKLARRPQSASSGRPSCDRASSATSSPRASASCSGGIASTPRTVERQLVVGLVVAEQRRQVGIEAHSPAKRVRERQSAGQRVGQQRAHPATAVGEVHRGFG